MDLFDKCYKFDRADQAIALGLYPYFQPIEENYGPTVRLNGKEVIMAGSNNYLGLTKHPEVIKAAKDAIDRFGTSCSGSRYLNGTLTLHTALEEELADFVGMEKCLLFTTGFLTNQGIIPTIVYKDEHIISDRENHASIFAGNFIAKAFSAHVHRYKSNNMKDLEKVISGIPVDAPKLLVSDAVFSMSGVVVNLPEFVRLAKKYRAKILIDEAHSIGVLGKGGTGVCSHFGLKNGKDVDLVMGTFSKSFASLGGFVAGPKGVIDFIKHTSKALIFSASMTPANVAAVRTSLQIIKREPERVARIREIGDYMRRGFKQVGLKFLGGITPIVPVIIGDDLKTFQVWKRMIEEGVFTNAIVSPATPPGMQLIRTSYIATHKNEHLDRIIEAFAKVGKEFGLISHRDH